jgi:hypothetical protein
MGLNLAREKNKNRWFIVGRMCSEVLDKCV